MRHSVSASRSSAAWNSVGIGLLGIGIGSVIGGTTVYFLFIRKKLDEIFVIQHRLRSELQNLKNEVQQLKGQQGSGGSGKRVAVVAGEPSVVARKAVKFAQGYETAEDEEYVTATSSELSSEEEDVGSVSGGLARRVPGSENSIVKDIKAQRRRPEKEDPSANFLKKIDELLEGDVKQQEDAYNNLKQNEANYSNSAEYWWRLAKAANYKATTAGNNGNKDEKKSYCYEAFSFAQKALELNSECSSCHKWYAITVGSLGDFVSTNEKIQNGYKFKEHIDRAIDIKPDDYLLHYLLGRFCYEVSQLTWIERQVAATLFSAPPSSSFEEALAHFRTAEKLGKPFKENRLYMAKCFLGMSDYNSAGDWLKQAKQLPVITPSDEAAQEEIEAIMDKYRRYF